MENTSVKYQPNNLSAIPYNLKVLPRKEYRTITVKIETFQKFVKEKHKAKIKNHTINNSTFLDSLLACKKIN